MTAAILLAISEYWLLVPLGIVTVIGCFISVMTISSIGEKDAPGAKFVLIFTSIIACLFVFWVWFCKENNEEKYTTTNGLELIETQYPKYNYDKGEYCIYHDDRFIPIQSVKGYASDSLALITGVKILKKNYPLMLGIFKVSGDNSLSYKDDYIYTTKITPEMNRVLINPQAQPAKLKKK